MNNTDASWRKYGEIEPYFGVLSDPKFERKNLTDESLHAFFESGQEHVRHIFQILQKKIDPDFKPTRALDYGCGVGRVVVPLAGLLREVVGVDIAEGMLSEAASNCRARGLSNVSFALADDALSSILGPFDLIHSFIVLQHIPAERGLVIISELLDRLADDGIAVIHIPYLRDVPRLKRLVDWARARSTLVHYAANIFKGRPVRRPLMQMNKYNLSLFFAILQKKYCVIRYVEFLNHAGNLGGIFYIQKQSAAS